MDPNIGGGTGLFSSLWLRYVHVFKGKGKLSNLRMILCSELAEEIKTGLRADARHLAATSQAQACLSVDARFLLAENEMIRMFGQEVLRGMNKQKRYAVV